MDPEFIYLLVKIQRGTQVSEPRMLRQGWNADEIHRNSVGPPQRCGGIGRRGLDEEFELWKIRLDVAARLSQHYPNVYSLLSEEEATGIYRWCAALRGDSTEMVNGERVPGGERVFDERRLLAIQVKISAGLALTEDDRKALDPDDEVPGINRPKTTAQEVFGGPAVTRGR